MPAYRARDFRTFLRCVAARTDRGRPSAEDFSKMLGASTLTGLPLCRSQLCAASTPVLDDFRFVGENRTFRQDFEPLVVAKRLLDDSVFEGMETNRDDATRAAKTPDCVTQAIAQRVELVVDDDA
jgi:hypothetical protein